VRARAYEIVGEGELRDAVGAGFPGLRLTRLDGNTVLSGPVLDQAELLGLLQRLWSLGATLIGLNEVEGVEAGSNGQPADENSFTRMRAARNRAEPVTI
jgi:hypothetical protein